MLAEAHKKIEDSYQQINDSQKRIEKAHDDMKQLVFEKKELGGKLESLLKNCFQRSWRQAEDLQRIEVCVDDLTGGLTHDLLVLERRKDFLIQLAAPLLKCAVKSTIEEQHVKQITE